VNIAQYLGIFKRRVWIVVIAALVTFAVVAAQGAGETPTYSTSALVRIAAGYDSRTSIDSSYIDRVVNTMVLLVTSTPLMDDAAARMGGEFTPDEIAAMVKVEAVANSELIRVTGQATQPVPAMNVANTVAAMLVEQGEKVFAGEGKRLVDSLSEQMATLQSQLNTDRQALAEAALQPVSAEQSALVQSLSAKIRFGEQTYSTLVEAHDRAVQQNATRSNSLSIVDPATLPQASAATGIPGNVVLGAVVGLVAGLGLALIVENADQSIHDADALAQATGTTLLGWVSRLALPRKGGDRAALLTNLASPGTVEAFRALSATLLTAMPPGERRTLLVTSAEDTNASTAVSSMLSILISRSGRPVLLVDGDMANPALHRVFGVQSDPGLADVIMDTARLVRAAQGTSETGLKVLACGGSQAQRAGLLGSSRMLDIVGGFELEADIVVVDCAGMADAADVALLAPLVDGVLMVGVRDLSSRTALAQAAVQLGLVKGHLMGAVYVEPKAERLPRRSRARAH
jgi:Mrp family chromosome partitioning ATPase/capsular polysaccharide biosynthesis protein